MTEKHHLQLWHEDIERTLHPGGRHRRVSGAQPEETARHQQKQPSFADFRHEPQEMQKALVIQGLQQVLADSDGTWQEETVPPVGAEHPQESSGNTGVGSESGAQSGALCGKGEGTAGTPADPLAGIAAAIASLTPADRARLVAMLAERQG